jgi:glycosyltransferase involved in cell wall biosynthesis
MKILLLTDGITPFVIGGMQKHSYNLARQLALQGHKVTLFHCVTGKNKLPERAEVVDLFGEETMKNLETICLRFPAPSWYPGHYLKESYLFSRMIYKRIESKISEFDFIYGKGFTAWYFLQQKKRGVAMPPVGIKFHGYEMFQPPASLKMKMENLLLSKPVRWMNLHADVVFSYGGKITKLIESLGVEHSKIIEIATGIDPDWISTRQFSVSTNEVHFCFIGRNERRKGIEELHAALKNMPEVGFHFHFIGPIPQSAQVKRKNITYHGALREAHQIKSILDSCQVLVTPSYSEGMPNVIMEGMARGLAILATPVGAVESIVNDENGWLIEPGNSVSLARFIENIAGIDRNLLIHKQSNSFKKIKLLTWDLISKETTSKIEEQLICFQQQ